MCWGILGRGPTPLLWWLLLRCARLCLRAIGWGVRASLRATAALCLLMGVASVAWLTAPSSYKGTVINRALPGTETNARAHLDPRFAKRLTRTLEAVRKDGHTPQLAVTYRSPERQDAIYGISKILRAFGFAGFTQVKGGRSCHNREHAERPAALAADVVHADPWATPDQQAEFFKALGRAARHHGLRWGGDWHSSRSPWRRYGMGWDPGHVQSRRCR